MVLNGNAGIAGKSHLYVLVSYLIIVGLSASPAYLMSSQAHPVGFDSITTQFLKVLVMSHFLATRAKCATGLEKDLVQIVSAMIQWNSSGSFAKERCLIQYNFA